MCVILLDDEVFTSSTFGLVNVDIIDHCSSLSHTRIPGVGGGVGVTPLFGPMELRAA